ncbi:MAG: carboxypeptidase regulatory-like domain-containing protein [Deltaproteobacteria bacterium]|jgi:outer membrane receptor protein involved in Fe transport
MTPLLLLLSLGAQAPSAPTSTIDLVVFRETTPAAGLEVRVDGSAAGETDVDGVLTLTVPSGRVKVELYTDSSTVATLDLLTDDDEVVQAIVTLHADGPPTVLFESSEGRAPVDTADRRQARERRKKQASLPPGAVTGRILSAEDQVPVVGARIYFSGTDRQVVTNDDGYFEAEVPVGTYSMSVIHPTFDTQTLNNIRVISAKKITVDVELTPTGIALKDYVVTAPYVEGSIASVIEAQRETSNVTEVLGAAQMSAAGDSNAADALQRVTGLTVEDGKYVLIRGQPYRYTSTTWNGSPLPSPEPLLRIVPLDLFPTGVLSGIEVQKTYSADKPGAFGAGLIDLQTRGVRDEAFFELSLGTQFNSVSTFSSGFDYQGGTWDLFGFDDGTRALPEEVNVATEGGDVSLDSFPDAERNMLGSTFRNIYNLDERTLPPDVGVTITGGTNFDLPGDGTLGVVATGQWGNQWRRQERIQRSFSGTDRLVTRNDFVEQRTDFNTNLSGLMTAEAQWEKHSFQTNTFWVHQTQQRSQLTSGDSRVSDDREIRNYLLSWIERDLLAQQLIGQHDFDVLKVDWRGLVARADRDAPDRREYEYSRREGQDRFSAFGNAGMNRSYNTVNELDVSAAVDVTVPIFDGEKDWLKWKVQAGAFLEITRREALTQLFRWRPDDMSEVDRFETDPELLYDPAATGTLLDFRDQSFVGSDDYTGNADVYFGYAQTDLNFGDVVRAVGGVHVESADVEVLTFQAADAGAEPTTGGFDRLDVLPALSLTWFVFEELQARGAYGRSISRPVFNEMSPAAFFDPDSGQEFLGNPDLLPATIDAGDFRLEWYPSSTESLSLAAFTKFYTDPIEQAAVQRAGSGTVSTLQNAKGAQVFGLELGGRFDLERLQDLHPSLDVLELFYVQANIALITSSVELADQGIATNAERPLVGQAPYVINIQAGLDGEEHDVVLSFNQIGERLFQTGSLMQPDFYLQPIGTLDITWTWRLWEYGALKLSGSNLLDPKFTILQLDRVWREFRKGFSVGASFKLTL